MTRRKITITDHGHLLRARITRRAFHIIPVTDWEAWFTTDVPGAHQRATTAAHAQVTALEAQDRKRRHREGR